jgi:transaldolase
MKLFLDSAILSEIEQVYNAGVCDGITMNPSLVKDAVDKLKESDKRISLESYISKVLKIAEGTPVSLEVTELDAKGMIEQGKALYKKFNPIAKNVYIKVPVNPSFTEETGKEFEGIKAIKELSKAGIPVNCTLVFTPEQALVAAKAGAKFVSPFCGRIDDMLRKEAGWSFDKSDYFPQEGIQKNWKQVDDNGIVSGIDLVRQTVIIFRNYGIKTEVLAASMRNARQVREAALAGASISTIGFNTFREIMRHKLTSQGMEKFTKDTPEEFKRLV